jgi:peptide-methionine (S)-S-oxide reductase
MALLRCTLGGGCFWCLEAVFDQVSGVTEVQSGYAGGTVANPTYEAVCTGKTGHAEVVQITYDDAEILFSELLDVFFAIHDPTTLNRQGADVGTQYRSVIFTHDEQQAEAAKACMAELSARGEYSQPIVTQIEPYTTFYPAEPYHTDYFARNPQQPYCQAVVGPKVAKFRKLFGSRVK